MRLAVLCTHPIQYYAPVFRELAQREGVELKVFFGWKGLTEAGLDHGFGQEFAWDIPLLDAYEHEFLRNVGRDPGTHRFRGIDVPDVCQRITAWQPDALLVYGWSWKAHLHAMRRLHGLLPLLFRGDSTLLDERPGLRQTLRRIFLRWVFRHVDLALYVGTQNRRYFEAHGMAPEQLIFTPHAVDHVRFSANAETQGLEARAWRNQLGIIDSDVVILFAGKLEHKKAPDVLLNAFRQAALDNTHLVFAGSGPLEPELRAGAGPHVHFLGFQNQSRMPVIYRLGDLFVLPSRGPGETWGLAVNEAMACGRAVVVTDKVGCAVDLVADGENGTIVPAEDAEALAAALRRLCARREALSAMGNASQDRIAAWSIERQVDGIVEGLNRASGRYAFNRAVSGTWAEDAKGE